MILKKSTILLSQPYLGDPNFDWTTILLCEYNDDGTYGFILNDKSNLLLEDVVEGFENTGFPIFYGGPVDQDALFFIHKMKDLPGALEVCKGVYVHGDFDELKSRVALGQMKSEDIRFFLGYSGWDKDQLGEEIERKSWFINNTHSKKVMNMEVDSLWRTILKEMGGKHKQYANYPTNPGEN